MTEDYEYIEQGALFHAVMPLVMGTRLEAVMCGVGRDCAAFCWNAISAAAGRSHAMLDRFSPDSEVSRINSGALAVDGASVELSGMLKVCEDYRRRTCGLFDVRKGGETLDFGGFAKGFILHMAAGILRGQGVGTALVNFGGSSMLAVGHNPLGQSWTCPVYSPYSGCLLSRIELRDSALSVSGNTPRYSGHIVNPLTGQKCDARRLTTVVCEDPLDAEVLSTALMLADSERIAQLKEAFPHAEMNIYDI